MSNTVGTPQVENNDERRDEILKRMLRTPPKPRSHGSKPVDDIVIGIHSERQADGSRRYWTTSRPARAIDGPLPSSLGTPLGDRPAKRGGKTSSRQEIERR